MWKLKNNKGVTLVELIVSFMLVSVTVIYFMQIIIVVRRIYKKSQEDTELFVNRTYAIKIFEACMEKNNNVTSNCSNKYGIGYTITGDSQLTLNGTNGIEGTDLKLTKYTFSKSGRNADTFSIYR